MLNKIFALIIIMIVIGGCNGSDNNPPVTDVGNSIEKLKDTAKDVVDHETGITYKQIDIKDNSDITIILDKNKKEFILNSGANNKNPEKLVVSGKLTIN